jgi:hypothetical protein
MTGQPWHEVLDALAVQLVKDGHCAISGEEAIFIRQETDAKPDTGKPVEEYHAVASATGGWIAQGKYMGGHTDKPVVVPPPSEGRPTSPMYLPPVRSEGGRWVRDGQPLNLVGAIPCWPTDGTGEKLIVDGQQIPYLWPLVSTEWIDHVRGKGANAVHLRAGPIGTSDTIAEMQVIGGPYTADGSDWNPKWWALLHRIIRHAGEAGFVAEIDGLDGWVVKNTIAGSWHMPFPAPDVYTAMQLPINPSVRKWIFKLVYETCLYGHATYQVGNETGVSGVGWSAEWERAMYALFREAEKQPGCDDQVVHMVGSNSSDVDGPYDYLVSHWTNGATGPIAGRPTEVNEYNPSLTPGQFMSLHCAAKRAGQSFWYWRSDGSDSRQDETLDLLKAGCDVPAECPAPQPNRENLAFNVACKPNGVCDATPLSTRDVGYCASIGMPYQPDGVTPRGACPMRNECPDTPGFEGMCESRLVCEQYALSVPGVCNATAPLWRSDGEVVLEDQYGFRARCNGCTWLEACNCDGSRCERGVF